MNSFEELKTVLKNEIIEELKTDSLKQEIIKELRPPEKKSFWGENSMARFILGFLLTGVIGSWLTTWWQSAQWKEQQKYMTKKQVLEQKLAITEEVTTAVAESFTVAENMLGLFTYWDDSGRVKEFSKSLNQWQESSHKWRIASKQLIPKLNANFTSSEVRERFDGIIKTRRRVGVQISNMLPELNKLKITNEDRISSSVRTTTALIDSVTGFDGELRDLIKTMINEAYSMHGSN